MNYPNQINLYKVHYCTPDQQFKYLIVPGTDWISAVIAANKLFKRVEEEYVNKSSEYRGDFGLTGFYKIEEYANNFFAGNFYK